MAGIESRCTWAVLEFHDSELVAVELTSEDMRLELLGYVHRWSAGKGTGWTFRIDIELTDGVGVVTSQLPIEIGAAMFR